MDQIIETLKDATAAVADRKGDYIVNAEWALGDAQEHLLLFPGKTEKFKHAVIAVANAVDALENLDGDYVELMDTAVETLKAL